MDYSRRDFLGITLSTVIAGSLPRCHEKTQKWLKIASYNIANARGNTDDMFVKRSKPEIISNLETIITMLQKEKVDVVCMNEVDYDSTRTYGIDQAEYIANGLGYNHVLKEVSFDAPDLLTLGNTIVSNHKLELIKIQQYGDVLGGRVRHTFKGFVDFNVLLEEPLNFVFTHIDCMNLDVRMEEVTYLLDYLQDKTNPFVLLGDFNSTPGNPAFEILNQSGILYNPDIGLPSYPSDNPKRSLDHIWISQSGVDHQMEMKEYHVVGTKASDHAAVIADVKTPL